MAHIGILCPGAIGHLNPMCNLGTELLHRGHRVTLFGVPDVKSKIAQSNLEFCEIGAEDFPIGSLDIMYETLGKLTGTEGLKFSVQFFLKEAKMLFQDAPEAIRNANIDLLLIDGVTTAGGTVADYLNIPFINVCNALPMNREPGVPPFFTHWRYKNVWWAKLRNKVGNSLLNYLTKSVWDLVVEQRSIWHLSPHADRNDSFSKFAQIAQLPQSLDFPRERLAPWFHYVGPLKNSSETELVSLDRQFFPFEKLNGKPLIYATLGTLQSHNLDIFQYIAQACQGMDAQLVISLGNPNADPSQMDFPGDPIVAAFPPHQQLINRAALVITHAGSTAVSCLSSGVPMVAIPITTDQPGMAARVAQAGAGEVVQLSKLTVPRLKAAIDRVFENPSYRENAAKLATAIQKSGGVNQAANIVEQVVETKAPMLRV
jgi:zeaxanthin glucosyltransferase